ncbi:MAG: hypothetical protein OEY52_02500 [Gammaproteobacteria bacterium]|nr:hypothetical protein [Gammaproteobacteria bacterium]
MEIEIRKSFIALAMSSSLALAGCGGGSGGGSAAPAPAPDEPTPEIPAPIVEVPKLKAHFFVGKSAASGSELWKSDGTAEGTALVKEINTASPSYPSNFIEVGGMTFFTADDGLHGKELHKSDGLETSLVKDIHPSGTSNPRQMTVFKGKLYFIANDDMNTAMLMESDGTAEGTVRLGSIAGVDNLTVMAADETLYFTTGNGAALWKFDGVTFPSSPIASASVPVDAPVVFNGANRLTVVGSNLYFVASNGFGTELWISNVSGTNIVKDLFVGTSSGLNANSKLHAVGDKLIFTNYNRMIYVTDGTDVNTLPVKNASNANVYIDNSYQYTGSNGSLMYFINSSGRAVWRTDGTQAGTFSVTTNYFYYMNDFQATANGDVYFNKSNNLWKSDGTLAGTVNVASNIRKHKVTKSGNRVYFYNYSNQYGYINNGGPYAPTTYLTQEKYNNSPLHTGADKLYFAYDDGVHSSEPWSSDGTADGTVMISDVSVNPVESSYPYDKAELNGKLYFVAQSSNEENELWVTDGTNEGTMKLGADIYDVRSLTASGDKMFFVADHDDYGDELWVTDGTEEGTHIVVDLDPGDNNSNPTSLVDANGTLFFIDGDNWMIWKTDGTLEGTLPVSGLIQPESALFAAGNKVYFVFYHENYEEELWVTDGTFAGTKMVKDINPDGSGVADYEDFLAASIGDVLYFGADDGSNGFELWKTDGTEEGTQMVINLLDTYDGLGYMWSFSNSGGFKVIDNHVYFLAYTENEEKELWKSDGTAEGTVQLTNFGELGGWVNFEAGIVKNKDEIFFSASNGMQGSELWKTNGTLEGTAMVKDINVDGDSYPYGLDVFNDILFFISNDGIHGNELWKSDGTEEGTIMVKDIAEGNQHGAEALEEGYVDLDD